MHFLKLEPQADSRPGWLLGRQLWFVEEAFRLTLVWFLLAVEAERVAPTSDQIPNQPSTKKPSFPP